MSFTAGSASGVYKTKHAHYTPVSFDGGGVYITKGDKVNSTGDGYMSRVNVKHHAFLKPDIIENSNTREDGTDVITLTNMQPSLVVYIWHRTR